MESLRMFVFYRGCRRATQAARSATLLMIVDDAIKHNSQLSINSRLIRFIMMHVGRPLNPCEHRIALFDDLVYKSTTTIGMMRSTAWEQRVINASDICRNDMKCTCVKQLDETMQTPLDVMQHDARQHRLQPQK